METQDLKKHMADVLGVSMDNETFNKNFDKFISLTRQYSQTGDISAMVMGQYATPSPDYQIMLSPPFIHLFYDTIHGCIRSFDAHYSLPCLIYSHCRDCIWSMFFLCSLLYCFGRWRYSRIYNAILAKQVAKIKSLAILRLKRRKKKNPPYIAREQLRIDLLGDFSFSQRKNTFPKNGCWRIICLFFTLDMSHVETFLNKDCSFLSQIWLQVVDLLQNDPNVEESLQTIDDVDQITWEFCTT
ncbi:hypothetical protein RFI_17162 [Reticulomyxa filosa]|uniref:Uncharacterized protein n=1 Tax=Reticulomyxa filosa TaxID=46433 RepID=X6N1V5_RETFI|nr:hypothetical protein RFI_17162 [Reticulomyxa filosa]|eukprot:ETO20056.1 hypothetical protein RFI_17162 [Reticulomyxa filosa]